MRYLIGIIAAVSIAAPAIAQDAGFYAGLHIGQATYKESCDGFGGTGVSCDDKDTAWKILGGYQFNRNFAAEFAYANLGEARASGPGGTASVEVTAFELVGVGVLPITDMFSVYGKLGMYRGEAELQANTVILTGSAKESNTDITFGFGVRVNITPRMALRGEWQRYPDVGGADIGEEDIDMMSIGVLFRF